MNGKDINTNHDKSDDHKTKRNKKKDEAERVFSNISRNSRLKRMTAPAGYGQLLLLSLLNNMDHIQTHKTMTSHTLRIPTSLNMDSSDNTMVHNIHIQRL